MKWLINWLATILPGYKTQILAWFTAGAGGIILLLDWLSTTDLTNIIPPQYYATYMLIVGLLTSLFRTTATVAAAQPETKSKAQKVQ